ncbi:hypothetical protein QQS21_011521 [Conoideocrella luteorostrata]|uniref:PA14 domain-containing protein n=1 Tax=Conoideocrella luteorostrata TaxID=1105319 RepID=A0AAJ0CD29_9HYPO|nr:hypothetical protein QQS21_011521 [Conoideocrella luteorostrata]
MVHRAAVILSALVGIAISLPREAISPIGNDSPGHPGHMPKRTTVAASCLPRDCSRGITFSRYINPFNPKSTIYQPFEPSVLSSLKPIDQGTTQTIYISAADGVDSNAAILWKTYLYVCQEGTYKFTSRHPKDTAMTWLGEEHTKKPTVENADIGQFDGVSSLNEDMTVERALLAGTIYPITTLWGNNGVDGFVELGIEGPDGDMVNGSEGSGAYFVTRTCGSNSEGELKV